MCIPSRIDPRNTLGRWVAPNRKPPSARNLPVLGRWLTVKGIESHLSGTVRYDLTDYLPVYVSAVLPDYSSENRWESIELSDVVVKLF